MSGSRARLAALASLALLLAACAGQRVQPLRPDAQSLQQQAVREKTLRARPDWSMRGRLGVSDGHDSGSGSLEWSQQADRFRFSVHAPVTGKTWVLSGDHTRAALEGLRAQPIEDASASALLDRELGWHVPVADLVDWVRGVRAPGAADIRFRPDGLPAQIEQDGWKVEYVDYDTRHSPPLPSKVFASKGNYTVRLAIRAWTLE